VGLLRYGERLMKGINAFTEADDRGKSFAMWRYEPGYDGDSVADIYLRFDFLLEADVARAVDVLGEFRKNTNAAIAAIGRRGEMGLPPFYRSVWLDRELTIVSDSAVLALLRRPYRVESDHSSALDVNLNIERWEKLAQLKLPELAHWSEFCFKARAVAEEVLRADPEFISSLAGAKRRTLRVDQGRLSQLRARSRINLSPGAGEELVFEERLAAAIQKGISAPTVRVDTIGAIFVSASRHATQHLAGGG
jgi:ATP-dependent helicase HepA